MATRARLVNARSPMMTCNSCWTAGVASSTANYYHFQNFLTDSQRCAGQLFLLEL